MILAELLAKIEATRSRLNESSNTKSIPDLDKEVLEINYELDELINEYYRLAMKKE